MPRRTASGESRAICVCRRDVSTHLARSVVETFFAHVFIVRNGKLELGFPSMSANEQPSPFKPNTVITKRAVRRASD